MGAFTYGLANLFILGGWVLLLVATISAPVIDRIGFLTVNNGGSVATFGALGYCTDYAAGVCSNARVGYPLSQIASQLAGGGSFGYSNGSADNATKGLILHPIAAGIAFLAQIIALASNQFGFLCASLIVFFAFLVSATVMALDFALFGIVRNAINNRATDANILTSSSGPASYSTAMWLVLAATISLLIAVLFTLFACCCGGDRRERRYGRKDPGYVGNQPQMTQAGYTPQRRHWWNMRNRY